MSLDSFYAEFHPLDFYVHLMLKCVSLCDAIGNYGY